MQLTLTGWHLVHCLILLQRTCLSWSTWRFQTCSLLLSWSYLLRTLAHFSWAYKRGVTNRVTSKSKIIYFVSKSLSQFEDFDVDSLERFSLRSCSQAGLLLFIPDEGAHMSSILDLELPQPASSFSTTSKSSKKLSFVLVWYDAFLALLGSSYMKH